MQPIPQAWLDRLRRLSIRLRLGRDWYLMLIAAVIGLVMAGVAMAFIYPLHLIEEWTLHASPGLLWWLVPIAPAVGALLCGVVNHLITTPGRGPGVTKVMYAIHRRHSRLPMRMALRKWIGSTLTIGSGGSAGAEGPIVTIGAVIGSNVGRLLGTNRQNTATLLGCGAAAGIASVFNAPIAGVFFVMEILLRDFSLRTFTPIVIASVISAAFTQSVLGNEALFTTSADLSIEPFTWREIPNYLMLGLVCGALAAIFIRSIYHASSLFDRLPVHPIARPVVGAAILGLLGLLFLLFASEPRMPAFYGNGYPVIRDLLSSEAYVEAGALRPVGPALMLLLAIGVFKGIATCLTISSGGAGGFFAPSLLLGATVGGLFGFIVNAAGWFPAADPAYYALVGMAAMVAATTHAPLTGILIVYEITQSYEIILPLMLAAVISTIVGRLVYRESVYTVSLTAQGVRVGGMSDLTLLRRLSASDVPLSPAVTVRPDDRAQRLLELSEEYAGMDFVVVDDQGSYAGMVTGGDLKAALVYREAIPLLQVNELQRTDLPTVSPDEHLDLVLDKFSRFDVQSLAMMADAESNLAVGLITRSQLMRRYQRALDED